VAAGASAIIPFIPLLESSLPGWLRAAADEKLGNILSVFPRSFTVKTRRVTGKPRHVGHHSTEKPDLSTAQNCKSSSTTFRAKEE
jgi:hypothetical protein